MLSALWRGNDLSTISVKDGVGASMQWYESTLIEEADATLISDTLNRQVDTRVISILFGDDTPLAKFRLKLPDYQIHSCELDIFERLIKLGLKPDTLELAKRFAFPVAKQTSTEATNCEGIQASASNKKEDISSGSTPVESESEC